MKVKNSNFVDYVKILCRSGKGGAGSAHFLRDRTTAKGGPDGGDGGRGGHIIIKGNQQLWTLLPLKYTKHIFAEHGGAGSGNHSSGKDGEDKYLEVPLGTVAKNFDTGEILGEITEHNQELILLKGGMGGRGNAHFKSSTNQSPHYAQPGIDSSENWFVLELKVLADIGLVGFPNAGKSTLLSVITAAKPEIADYPFTTLVPNLGIVSYRDHKSFIMADIPGIIEGASSGKGLGHYFLRHVERNSILLFLISAEHDIHKRFLILREEMLKFNPELLDKKFIVAISKIDLIEASKRDLFLDKVKKDFKSISVLVLSSVINLGLNSLKDELWIALNSKQIE